MEGWIKLYRGIQDHWVWQDPVKLKWWLDILISANHEDNKFNVGMQIIECKRGQSIMSLQSWANRWNVSKDTARNFFTLLKKDEMILMENLSRTTRITVCNYETYQETLHVKQTVTERLPNDEQTLSDPNKNVKNNIIYTSSIEEVQNEEKKDKPKRKKKEATVVEKNINTDARKIFEARYHRETREQYYWSAKDAGNMTNILNALKHQRTEKGLSNDDDTDVLAALSIFINTAVKDDWIKKNLSVSVLFSKYNEIVARARQEKERKTEQPKYGLT